MKSNATENNFNFPYLYDESQQVAKDYDAACTPDFYLFDSELKLIYRGQLDDSRPGNELECDGADLKNALDCLLEGKENNGDVTLNGPAIRKVVKGDPIINSYAQNAIDLDGGFVALTPNGNIDDGGWPLGEEYDGVNANSNIWRTATNYVATGGAGWLD